MHYEHIQNRYALPMVSHFRWRVGSSQDGPPNRWRPCRRCRLRWPSPCEAGTCRCLRRTEATAGRLSTSCPPAPSRCRNLALLHRNLWWPVGGRQCFNTLQEKHESVTTHWSNLNVSFLAIWFLLSFSLPLPLLVFIFVFLLLAAGGLAVFAAVIFVSLAIAFPFLILLLLLLVSAEKNETSEPGEAGLYCCCSMAAGGPATEPQAESNQTLFSVNGKQKHNHHENVDRRTSEETETWSVSSWGICWCSGFSCVSYWAE